MTFWEERRAVVGYGRGFVGSYLVPASRPDGQPRKSADSTRPRALTGGYTPRITLRAGIEEMAEWYCKLV